MTTLRSVPQEVLSLEPGSEKRLKCWECEDRGPRDRTLSVKVDLDGRGGVVHCFRCGVGGNYFTDPAVGSLSAAEQNERRALWRAAQERSREQRHQSQREVALQAERQWTAATACISHAYLNDKGVTLPRSLKVDADGWLLVPAFDATGKMWSLQRISPEGDKRFLTGGKIAGTYYPVGTSAPVDRLIICEGLATGLSIFAATEVPVVVAWSAGNLLAVCQAMRQKFSAAAITVAADDDYGTEGNPGLTKATEAAASIGARLVQPVFGPGVDRGTDFNDLHTRVSLIAVQLTFTVPVPVELPAGVARLEGVGYAYTMTKDGDHRVGSLANIVKWLIEETDLASQIWYDRFDGSVRTTLFEGGISGQRGEREWSDLDDSWLTARVSRLPDFSRVTSSVVRMAVDELARHNQRDRVRDRIASYRWDGTPRLSSVADLGFGAGDGLFEAAAMRNLLIACAKRQSFPGSKFDHAVVLIGPQGIGKSTALQVLFGDQYVAQVHGDIASKDVLMQTNGRLCLELDELASLGKSQREALKSFLSIAVDKFRPPYGRRVVSVPRRWVVVGTTNEQEFLNDPTGERRWWPVESSVVNLDWLTENREQLWAEAWRAAIYGENYFNVPEHAVALEQAREIDPWEEPVLAYMYKVVREALEVSDQPRISASAIFKNALEMSVDRRDTRAWKRMAAILRRHGWLSRKNNGITTYRPPPTFVSVVMMQMREPSP